VDPPNTGCVDPSAVELAEHAVLCMARHGNIIQVKRWVGGEGEGWVAEGAAHPNQSAFTTIGTPLWAVLDPGARDLFQERVDSIIAQQAYGHKVKV